MAFCAFRDMSLLQLFPKLERLCLMSVDVNQISGLEFCPNLQSIWICYCPQLKSISGWPSNLCQLTELHLYAYQSMMRRKRLKLGLIMPLSILICSKVFKTCASFGYAEMVSGFEYALNH
jgi:hypothetical protein